MANDSEELGPEPSGIILGEPLPGVGDWLAGEPAGKHVNCSPVAAGIESFNVGVAVCIGEVLGEYLLTEGVYFTLKAVLPAAPFCC